MVFLRHNWATPYKARLSFETMIYQSFLQKEQRRALRTTPLIEVTIDVLEWDEIARQIMGSKFEYIYALFAPERFTGNRGGVGSHIINITDGIDDCYILNNVANIYICDGDGNIAKVSSVTPTTIFLEQDLAGTSNYFYPCLKSFTKNIEKKFSTDSVVSFTITLEHIKE